MNILDLPPNVIINIFQYLEQKDVISSVRETCKIWSSLSYERCLWKTFDVRKLGENAPSPKSFLKILTNISDCVECLHIDLTCLGVEAILHEPVECLNLKNLFIHCSKVTRDEDGGKNSTKEIEQVVECLPALSKKYPHLRSLHIFGEIVEGDLCELHDIFPDLMELELEFCPDSSFLEEFCNIHKCLTNVTVRNSVIGSKALACLLTQLPNLETLDLLNTSTNVYDFSFHDINEEDLVVSCLRNVCLDKTPCSDFEFSAIVKKAPKLEYVSIIACQKLTNCGIESLAENCPNLKELYINRHPYTKCNITNAGLQSIGENCKDLRVLLANYCSEIDNLAVEAIAENCHNLRELSVSGCTALTDNAVLTLVAKCQFIQRLDLGHCVQLTSKCVNAVLANLHHVKYLNLETCHRLTDINLSVPDITLYNTQHRLDIGPASKQRLERRFDAGPMSSRHDALSETRRLQEGNTSNIENSDAQQVMHQSQESTKACNISSSFTEKESIDYAGKSLQMLENHCHLRELNLSFCSKITNNCLRQIAYKCPDLQKLDVQGCSMVTNAGVRYLTEGCKLLQILIISGGSMSQTSRLTDDCLFQIANVCELLQELVIVKNHNITSDGIFEVINKCPKIAKVKVTVSKRSNLKLESLSALAEKVEGKILCIKYVGDVEILVTNDQDKNIH